MRKGVIYEIHAEERRAAYGAIGAHLEECLMCRLARFFDLKCSEGKDLERAAKKLIEKQREEEKKWLT